jgi:hypothetical protein
MASRPVIDDFAMDDINENEIAEHGITQRQLFEVLDSHHHIKKNRRGRRATHMVIGRDQQGQCIAIPVEPTTVRTTWRPVTAWFCKPHEWGWLPRHR